MEEYTQMDGRNGLGSEKKRFSGNLRNEVEKKRRIKEEKEIVVFSSQQAVRKRAPQSAFIVIIINFTYLSSSTYLKGSENNL